MTSRLAMSIFDSDRLMKSDSFRIFLDIFFKLETFRLSLSGVIDSEVQKSLPAPTGFAWPYWASTYPHKATQMLLSYLPGSPNIKNFAMDPLLVYCSEQKITKMIKGYQALR